jgi:hypothetical protein
VVYVLFLLIYANGIDPSLPFLQTSRPPTTPPFPSRRPRLSPVPPEPASSTTSASSTPPPPLPLPAAPPRPPPLLAAVRAPPPPALLSSPAREERAELERPPRPSVVSSLAPSSPPSPWLKPTFSFSLLRRTHSSLLLQPSPTLSPLSSSTISRSAHLRPSFDHPFPLSRFPALLARSYPPSRLSLVLHLLLHPLSIALFLGAIDSSASAPIVLCDENSTERKKSRGKNGCFCGSISFRRTAAPPVVVVDCCCPSRSLASWKRRRCFDLCGRGFAGLSIFFSFLSLSSFALTDTSRMAPAVYSILPSTSPLDFAPPSPSSESLNPGPAVSSSTAPTSSTGFKRRTKRALAAAEVPDSAWRVAGAGTGVEAVGGGRSFELGRRSLAPNDTQKVTLGAIGGVRLPFTRKQGEMLTSFFPSQFAVLITVRPPARIESVQWLTQIFYRSSGCFPT